MVIVLLVPKGCHVPLELECQVMFIKSLSASFADIENEVKPIEIPLEPFVGVSKETVGGVLETGFDTVVKKKVSLVQLEPSVQLTDHQ